MKKLFLILMMLCFYATITFGFVVDKSQTVTGTSGSSATVTILTDGATAHYVTNIKIYKFATTTLTAGTTPITCTTTNFHSMTFPFPNDAQVQGTIEENKGNFTDALGAPTITDMTIVCPATTDVIWTITVIYAY